MSDQAIAAPTHSRHGSFGLPGVRVVSYNVALKDEDGFIGDRASKGAFREFIEQWRVPLREIGQDPFGEQAGDIKDQRRRA